MRVSVEQLSLKFTIKINDLDAHIGVYGAWAGGGGGGGEGLQPPIIFQIAIFGQKKQVVFGQNHLIFGQAMAKIFGQETSAPPPPRTKLVPYAYGCR